MKANFVIPLKSLGSDQVAVAGGKGASLGELMRSGARVPGGFVVTRTGFDTFRSQADPQDRVSNWLAEVDADRMQVNDAASAIADLLEQAEIPQVVQSAIETGVERLAAVSMSVRSSATCEDGISSAWAGQLDTFLDVGPDEIVAQVRACWMSMFRASALAYGAAHGYGAGAFGVAVVVQEMVWSEVSGIGFSVHPVTQEPDMRLIEACLGQGEAIVSGRISPDQYVVKRGGESILEKIRGQQREGLYLVHGAAKPQWRELAEQGAEQKLTDPQVLEYARLLDRIESHYGYPVDTEWAFADGTFYLLQARPITTLAKEYREPIVDDSEPWMKLVRRPLSLLEVSIIAHWMDSRHSGQDFGLHVDRFLAIQDDADLVQMYCPQSAMDTAMEHLRELEKTDRKKMIGLLERGHEVYRRGQARLDGGKEFENIHDAGEFFAEIGRFTTAFPAWTLIALEQGHLDDAAVRELAEGLRSHSLYPQVAQRLLEPVAERQAAALGFSQPQRACELATWKELEGGLLDRNTLERRLEAIDTGQRYVYQCRGDQEQLRFVSETGYLLMRESGQRQIVAADDPNCVSGQVAWPGVHRGRARVVLSSDPSQWKLDDGDVLVSLQSNPNLMPLLRHAGAIVTDDGGVACHAGIICRELKIPTIIGTARATTVIGDGDLVEVDATEGVVRILERASG